jgi:hypothetical protein
MVVGMKLKRLVGLARAQYNISVSFTLLVMLTSAVVRIRRKTTEHYDRRFGEFKSSYDVVICFSDASSSTMCFLFS